MITYYDANTHMQENGIIKGVFVYSLTVDFTTNQARLVFSKLSTSQLNKLKNKFASSCNAYIKTMAKAMGFDAEDMPRIFNDQIIDFTQEQATIRAARTDEILRQYVFDLE